MNKSIFEKLKQVYSALGLGDAILQGLADSLAATNLVTEDNIDEVVSAQKTYLENLQKANDKRVTDAVKKAQENAKKEAEEAQLKALEDAKNNATAEQKAAIEKAIADYKAKIEKEQQERDNTKSEEYNQMMSNFNSMKEDNAKAIADMKAAFDQQLKAQLETLNALKTENETMKAQAAKAAHDNLVVSIAKELGIPQYRIDEGFANIANDATSEDIKSKLEVIATNIKTNMLPSNSRNVLDTGAKATDAEIDAIVNQLI